MRYTILAGAAALAFGASPAMAQGPNPFFVPLIALGACASQAYEGVPQVQCGVNYDQGHHNNQYSTFGDNGGGGESWDDEDGSHQSIKQTQKAKLPYYFTEPEGNIQLQVGANIISNGDNDSQHITQTQKLKDYSLGAEPEGTLQFQGALNVAVDADNDHQSITQSQSLQIGSRDTGIIIIPPGNEGM